MTDLTQERLKQLFHYDPETGIFHRFVSTNNRWKAGPTKGSKQGNYLTIGIDGKRYMAHRVAFLYMTGSWPEHEIDHINRDTFDNRFSNLRNATKSQNQANRGAKDGGPKGVFWNPKFNKWRAAISKEGRRYDLGHYKTKEEAAEVYYAKAVELYGPYARRW